MVLRIETEVRYLEVISITSRCIDQNWITQYSISIRIKRPSNLIFSLT